jgi:hypothetical protein
LRLDPVCLLGSGSGALLRPNAALLEHPSSDFFGRLGAARELHATQISMVKVSAGSAMLAIQRCCATASPIAVLVEISTALPSRVQGDESAPIAQRPGLVRRGNRIRRMPGAR